MADIPPSCHSCKHWLPLGGGLGECRRYAPSPDLLHVVTYRTTAEGMRAKWPATQAHDYCGEHQTKEAADAGDVPAGA